jgi:hypothetical protein
MWLHLSAEGFQQIAIILGSMAVGYYYTRTDWEKRINPNLYNYAHLGYVYASLGIAMIVGNWF